MASAVVGAFDPGDDCESEFSAGCPAFPVEHFFGVGRRKDSIAALSPQAPTRPIDPRKPCRECGDVFSGSELAAAVGMDVCRRRFPGDNRVAQGVDRKVVSHSLVDRVSDDVVGEDVFDGAEIQFPFTGGCSLMSVSQRWPAAVAVKRRVARSSCAGGPLCGSGRDSWRTRSRSAAYETDSRPGGSPPATTGSPAFVGDEPVAERGVVVVNAVRGVDQVRIVPIPLRHRILAPLIEGLSGEAQNPAGHRDGYSVGGEVEDQRVDYFGLTSRERYATARRITSASCSNCRIRFFVSLNSADSCRTPRVRRHRRCRLA